MLNKENYLPYKLYRRKWRLTVVPMKKFEGINYQGEKYAEDDAIILSDSDFEEGNTHALHVRFNVNSSLSVPKFGEVTIYNLSNDMMETLKQGTRVVLEAGYEDGNFGVIWNANIYHFIERRENIVDRVLTMHCMDGYEIFKDCFVYAHVTKDRNTILDQYKEVVKQTGIDAVETPAALSDSSNKKSARAATIIGSPSNAINEISKSANGTIAGETKMSKIAIVDGKVTITDPNSIGIGEELVISPETGLIGTPSATQYGVIFRSLLDPRLLFTDPLVQVKIERSEVIAQPQRYGQTVAPVVPPRDGRYKVISVNHIGDTRGTEWYSDCECVVNPDQIINLGQLQGLGK